MSTKLKDSKKQPDVLNEEAKNLHLSEPVSAEQPLLRLLRHLKSHKLHLIAAVAASTANKIFDLAPPLLIAWIIDTATRVPDVWILSIFPDHEGALGALAILIVIVFFLESLFEYISLYLFNTLAQKIQHELRTTAFAKLELRELAYFESERSGNVVASLTEDVNQTERFLRESLNEMSQYVTLILFAIVVLFSENAIIAIVALSSVPFIVGASIFYQKFIAKYYTAVREANGKLASRINDSVGGIQVIKAFASEQYEADRVIEASKIYKKANYSAVAWSSAYVPSIRLPITISYALALWLASNWVLDGTNGITVGDLALFHALIQRILWPLTRLGQLTDEMSRATASARRVFTLIDTPPALKDGTISQLPLLKKKKPLIVFKNVEFSYHEGQPILRQLSLEIMKGQTIGICGVSGAGKTSLVKLLLRLYDCQKGAVEIAGKSVDEYLITVLRQQFALVSQSAYLFHGTIRDNIAYANPDTALTDIVEVAKKAHLHEFITGLPLGYDSVVGERGVKLSGGQQQRLTLARALLRNASVLLLDESTSAVDTVTETAIQRDLNILTKKSDITTIIIAHRLSTIRNADKIFCLAHGSVAESGTHDELVQNEGGIYHRLWTIQAGDPSARLALDLAPDDDGELKQQLKDDDDVRGDDNDNDVVEKKKKKPKKKPKKK